MAGCDRVHRRFTMMSDGAIKTRDHASGARDAGASPCRVPHSVSRRVRCASWCVVTTQSRRAGDRPSRRRSHAALHQRVKPPPG
jgi:hypothetical protein